MDSASDSVITLTNCLLKKIGRICQPFPVLETATYVDSQLVPPHVGIVNEDPSGSNLEERQPLRTYTGITNATPAGTRRNESKRQNFMQDPSPHTTASNRRKMKFLQHVPTTLTTFSICQPT